METPMWMPFIGFHGEILFILISLLNLLPCHLGHFVPLTPKPLSGILRLSGGCCFSGQFPRVCRIFGVAIFPNDFSGKWEGNLLSCPQAVWQDRNEHNLIHDFKEEYDLYTKEWRPRPNHS